MVEKSKLDEDKEGKDVDPSYYHGMIGTLLYLTSSRPDLQFAICMCARYQARPTEKHLNARTRSSMEYTIPKDLIVAISTPKKDNPSQFGSDSMADARPMAEQLQAPTGGFESATVVPVINAQNFELKSSLINLVQNRIFRGVSTNAPPLRIPSSTLSSNKVAAQLEDKMTLTFRNEMNEMKNMMKALVPTPAPIKAVEERCTTCGNNHSSNVCPMTRGGYESPVYHDNFQQFQQTLRWLICSTRKCRYLLPT
ncbi:hypothetical protein Tco_0833745 [Tanacetum coccineum]